MGIWYNRGHRMLVFHKLVWFFGSSWNVCKINCAKIPQWLCIINTLFSLSKTVVFISVHVSLNNNELLLTPPLSTIFYAFGGALLSKTKLIYCVLIGFHVWRKWRLIFTFKSNYKTPALLTRHCCCYSCSTAQTEVTGWGQKYINMRQSVSGGRLGLMPYCSENQKGLIIETV